MKIHKHDNIFGTTIFTGAVIRYGDVKIAGVAAQFGISPSTNAVGPVIDSLCLIRVKKFEQVSSMDMVVHTCTFSSRILCR